MFFFCIGPLGLFGKNHKNVNSLYETKNQLRLFSKLHFFRILEHFFWARIRLRILYKKKIGKEHVDLVDKNQRTALHWAASIGAADYVELLLKIGANANLPDAEGKLPLHWALSLQKSQDENEKGFFVYKFDLFSLLAL